MTMAADKQDKVLNFSSEREQSRACSSSAEREKNQGKNFLNVPTLRFPEFSGEWISCKVGDYGKIITGSTPPTSDNTNYADGTHLWASPVDLGQTKYVIDTQTKLSSIGFGKTRKLPAGSVLLTCIGSTIGKMGMAAMEMSTNQQINSIVVDSQYDNNFVYYALQSRFPRYLTSVAVQAVPIMSKSSFEKLQNYRTALEEQKKIGALLNLIDERISTQIRIIDKLQSLMKGLAEHLTAFTPNTKIADCLNCHSSILQENQVKNEGKYKVYGANGICGYSDSPTILEDAILIVKDGSGVGNVSYASGEYSVIGTSNYLTAKSGYSLKYLYFCLMIFNFVPYRTGMAIPHIYFKDYGKALIPCPSLNKQEQIATLLSKIECKIETEKSITESYLRQKRFLLQSMFI